MPYYSIMINEYWFVLSFAEFLSFKEKYSLLMRFGEPERIFKASYGELLKTGILTTYKINKLLGVLPDRELGKKIIDGGIRICCFNDPDYPSLLKYIYSPPVLLYYRGNLPDNKCIAVVGSRKCSVTGSKRAFEISRRISATGCWVASGLAKGIDCSAHTGALESGKTLAVLGCGLNVCYPAENRFLMKRIERCGCVMSEFIPDKKPSKYSFPARNRIISGISQAVVVVEAALKSGALITADFGLEQGKDIYAFNYEQIDISKGTSDLINDGAIPINDIEEFLLDLSALL